MSTATATVDAVSIALERDERRERRASYQRAGGSRRRPLHSFLTAAEKREKRLEHAERVREALAYVATPEGFSAWLEARELNPQLSPLGAALVGLQAPGYVIGTLAQWKRMGYRVRKGQVGGIYLTAPGFWPAPAFAAAQTDAPAGLTDPDPVALPIAEVREQWLAELRDRFAADGQRTPTLNGFAESRPEDVERETITPSWTPSDDLPF